MAFVKKTWKDRIVQYANRRLLTKSGGEVEQVTVTRDEGTISEAGDQFNASNMNDLENRVDNGFSDLNAADLPITSGSATNTKDYIDGRTASDIEYSSGVTVKQKIDSLVVKVGPDGDFLTFASLKSALSSGDIVSIIYANPTDLPSGWLNYGIGIAGKWSKIGSALLVLGVKTDGSANLQTF